MLGDLVRGELRVLGLGLGIDWLLHIEVMHLGNQILVFVGCGMIMSGRWLNPDISVSVLGLISSLFIVRFRWGNKGVSKLLYLIFAHTGQFELRYLILIIGQKFLKIFWGSINEI